ncbi:DNA-packaging protein [Pseudomonas sp. PS02288]|uniref:DNA-packaging protein n=1 Tax=Pseudomonas sp. PS02288 TaxID=2991443 RepID=UPI00249B2937|nr:DNA-packaging protein [Pseudomonas sp. PS02288]
MNLDRLWQVLGVLVPIALGVLLVAAIRSNGYSDGHEAAQADGNRALAELRAEYAAEKQAQAEAGQKAAEAAAAKLRDEQARGNQLAADLAAEKDKRRKTTDRLIGEIARVNDLYRAALDAPAEPLPACVFTTGFVRVWNEASGIAASASVPTNSGASGVAATTLGAGAPDDLVAPGIGRTELLTNHVRNAEQCSVIRKQLNLLIDWETHGRN